MLRKEGAALRRDIAGRARELQDEALEQFEHAREAADKLAARGKDVADSGADGGGGRPERGQAARPRRGGRRSAGLNANDDPRAGRAPEIDVPGHPALMRLRVYGLRHIAEDAVASGHAPIEVDVAHGAVLEHHALLGQRRKGSEQAPVSPPVHRGEFFVEGVGAISRFRGRARAGTAHALPTLHHAIRGGKGEAESIPVEDFQPGDFTVTPVLDGFMMGRRCRGRRLIRGGP